MKRILITGGLGNLGSWLTRHFVANGFDVDVLATNQRPILEDLSFNFISCDISDFSSCKKSIQDQYDIIIHTASVNDAFIDHYFEKSILVNTLGTRNILEVVKEHTTLKHFIYFSTFQVYGQYEGTITEDSNLKPKNDYGSTHLFSEILCQQLHQTHQLPYSIIRLTNSYGCPTDYNSSKWYLILNDLSKMAVEKQEIVLKSNGKAPRDFIWMQTVCEVLEKLALSSPTHDVFNLSGETTFNMLEVAQAIQEAYLETFQKEIPIQTNKEDKSEFPNPMFVDSSKLKSIIPYTHTPQFVKEAKNIFSFLEQKLPTTI